jgi:hypothetical protein
LAGEPVSSLSTSRKTLDSSARDSRRATLADAEDRLPGPLLLPPDALPPLVCELPALALPPGDVVSVPHATSDAARPHALTMLVKRCALHLNPFSARIPSFYPMHADGETVTKADNCK